MLPSSFCAQLLPLCRRMFAFQMDIAFPYSVQVSLLYSMFEPPSRSFYRCLAAFASSLYSVDSHIYFHIISADFGVCARV